MVEAVYITKSGILREKYRSLDHAQNRADELGDALVRGRYVQVYCAKSKRKPKLIDF